MTSFNASPFIRFGSKSTLAPTPPSIIEPESHELIIQRVLEEHDSQDAPENSSFIRSDPKSEFLKLIAEYTNEKKHRDKKPTHSLMGRSKELRWPEDAPPAERKTEKELIMKLYSCLATDYDASISQIFPDFFPMTIDIDLKADVDIPGIIGQNYGELFIKTLKLCFPNIDQEETKEFPSSDYWDDEKQVWMGGGYGTNRYRSLVCMRKCTVETKNGKPFHKRGLHIYNIGRLMVTQEEACAFAVIFRMICDEDPRTLRKLENGENINKDAIDILWTKSKSSLRMPFCSKPVACFDCAKSWEDDKIKKRHQSIFANYHYRPDPVGKFSSNICGKCFGTKWFLNKQGYTPLFVFDKNGNPDITFQLNVLNAQDKLSILLACSFRTRIIPSDLKDYERFVFPTEIYGNMAQFLKDNINETTSKKGSKKKDETESRFISSNQYLSDDEYYASNSKPFIYLLKYIQSLNPCWSDLEGNFLKRESGTFLFSPVPGPKDSPSKFCSIKNDYHTGATISWRITIKGIYQICNSSKDKCGGKSKFYEISGELASILFPDHELKKGSKGGLVRTGTISTPYDFLLKKNTFRSLKEQDTYRHLQENLKFCSDSFIGMLKRVDPEEHRTIFVDEKLEMMMQNTQNPPKKQKAPSKKSQDPVSDPKNLGALVHTYKPVSKQQAKRLNIDTGTTPQQTTQKRKSTIPSFHKTPTAYFDDNGEPVESINDEPVV